MAKDEKLKIAEELLVLIFLTSVAFLHEQKWSLDCGFAFPLSSCEILFSRRGQDCFPDSL